MPLLDTVIRAAIDIGSNSTELTVAACTTNSLNILQSESTMTRLGESVQASGSISQEKQELLLSTLRRYLELAQQHNATAPLVVATEALRKAENREAVLQRILQETGLQVHIISGTIEAALTHYGAISEFPSLDAGAVVDVGGGSSELIFTQHERITWLTSLPLGSGGLHDRYLYSDPSTTKEIKGAKRAVQEYLETLPIPALAGTLVATGSSAKTLLQLAQEALKVRLRKKRLTRNDLHACLGLLTGLPAQEVAERYGMKIERARVLPAGALLLLRFMHFLGVEELQISARGIREGVLLAYERFGEAWLTHPEVNIVDERAKVAPEYEREKTPHQKEFAESGREELQKRAKTFVEWIGPVLQNEDIESVHKMRVASRRLRATLDAYEVACEPKLFKEVYRQVKEAADLLGNARDTDVMLHNLETILETSPGDEQAGIRWFMRRLREYRERRQRKLDIFLKKFDADAFVRRVVACIPERVSQQEGVLDGQG